MNLQRACWSSQLDSAECWDVLFVVQDTDCNTDTDIRPVGFPLPWELWNANCSDLWCLGCHTEKVELFLAFQSADSCLFSGDVFRWFWKLETVCKKLPYSLAQVFSPCEGKFVVHVVDAQSEILRIAGWLEHASHWITGRVKPCECAQCVRVGSRRQWISKAEWIAGFLVRLGESTRVYLPATSLVESSRKIKPTNQTMLCWANPKSYIVKILRNFTLNTVLWT